MGLKAVEVSTEEVREDSADVIRAPGDTEAPDPTWGGSSPKPEKSPGGGWCCGGTERGRGPGPEPGLEPGALLLDLGVRSSAPREPLSEGLGLAGGCGPGAWGGDMLARDTRPSEPEGLARLARGDSGERSPFISTEGRLVLRFSSSPVRICEAMVVMVRTWFSSAAREVEKVGIIGCCCCGCCC